MIGVYQIICLADGCSYVGSSNDIGGRWYYHRNDLKKNKHHSFLLQKAWNLYGESKFRFVVLEEHEEHELLDREQHYLDTLRPEYNIAIDARAPTRGRPLSVEHKAKIAAALKDRMFSLETRAKISASLMGKKVSEETKTKLRVINLGNKHSDGAKAKIAAASKNRWDEGGSIGMIGPMSEEHKDKIGAGLKKAYAEGRRRKSCSEETRAKMRESAKNRWERQQNGN